MAYAIIKTGGKQYRVQPGQYFDVEKLDVPVGEKTTFSEVLFHSDGDKVTQGAPFISGATVVAEILDQHKDDKVIAFKYKRRKGYHRTVGHRRRLTRVKVESISL